MTRHRLLLPCALFALATIYTNASAYFVFDSGNVTAQAGVDDTTHDTHYQSIVNSYNSGQVTQLSTSGATLGNAAGSCYSSNNGILSQTAEGHVEDSVQIGKMHATVSAVDNSGAGTTSDNYGFVRCHSTDDLQWSDNVYFHSGNPSGSDFTLTLSLDDAITVLGGFQLFEDGGFEGVADASISILSDSSFMPTPTPINLLRIVDKRTITSTNTRIDQPPSNRSVSFTFHLVGDGRLHLLGDLSAQAIGDGGIGQILVNASNTANFNITTDDPLASYTTDSGTIFTPDAPEPASLSLLATTAALLLAKRRR
jgi:hypothetical protein